SDAVVFGETEEGQVRALSNSFEAANTLFRALDPSQPTNIVFLSPFLYVVTLRIAILKQLRPNYYCERSFQDEFQQHIDRANYWIQQINNAIASLYTVQTSLVISSDSRGHTERNWVATIYRSGVQIQQLVGPDNDASLSAKQALELQAN